MIFADHHTTSPLNIDMTDTDYNQMLLSSCASGDISSVTKLIAPAGFWIFSSSPKADINKMSKTYETPLGEAVIHGHVAVVRLLLQPGADKETRNQYAETPLH